MDIMTEHHCNSCNLDFKNIACYKKHLKTSRHIERITNPDIIKISCICGKSYSYNQSLYVHQKKCERHQQNKLLSKSQKHAPLQVNRLKNDKKHVPLQKDPSQKVKEPSQKEPSQKEPLQNESLQNEPLRKESTFISIMRKEIEEMKAKLEVLEAQSERMQQQLKFYARHELNRELAVLIAAREHNKKQDKRKKISKGVRQKIAENQQNKCGECEQILTPFFHLDHIVGLQFGGTDEESNLMALCYECHTKKTMCENKCRKQIRDAIQTVLRENMIKIKN